MTISKGLYWHEFQKSNCFGSTAIILMESANA